MIDLNISLVIQLANFLVMIFIMNKLIFSPILEVLDKRDKKLDGLKSASKELNEKVAGLEVNYKTQLDDIRKDSMRLMESAKKEATTEKESIVNKARETYSSKLDVARKEISSEVENVSKELKSHTESYAKTLVSKVLGRKLS